VKAVNVFVLAAAAFMLGACNLVVSPTPVFSPADAAGAPPFKPGLWASPDPGCTFDAKAPLDGWPKCANGSEIQPDAMIAKIDPSAATAQNDKSGSGPRKVALKYVLAAGDPRVLQVDLHIREAGLGELGFFYFVAVKPTRFDADGRITAAQLWPIQCGPPPPPQATPNANGSDMSKGMVTQHPLPGLKVDNGECTPVDKDAVRNAAVPSRAWADNIGELRWVRPADHDR
jgi:hypothetical protein